MAMDMEGTGMGMDMGAHMAMVMVMPMPTKRKRAIIVARRTVPLLARVRAMNPKVAALVLPFGRPAWAEEAAEEVEAGATFASFSIRDDTTPYVSLCRNALRA